MNDQNKSIPIPTKTQKRLQELITAAQGINAQIDAIVGTLRDALDVPEDYTIKNVQEGFVASESIELAN